MNLTPDSRNVTDEYKGMAHVEIVESLDKIGITLEIAIVNLERDFNMGSIVRTANAFGVRRVHVIGRKQWNKRGAMATDKYLTVEYHTSSQAFIAAMKARSRCVVAVDNVEDAREITDVALRPESVLVFGSEANGISTELLDECDGIVMIKQRGSTRSLNVAAAAAVAVYEWSRQNA